MFLNPSAATITTRFYSYILYCILCIACFFLIIINPIFFSTAETQVCFRYYHGVTGALRATTPSVIIKKGSAPVSLSALYLLIVTHAALWRFSLSVSWLAGNDSSVYSLALNSIGWVSHSSFKRRDKLLLK